MIHYCTGCNWLLRSAWLTQELLSTFPEQLHEVSLRPSKKSGIFTITLGEEVIWDRKIDGGFPEAKELKRRVRDHIDPNRDLGHIDK